MSSVQLGPLPAPMARCLSLTPCRPDARGLIEIAMACTVTTGTRRLPGGHCEQQLVQSAPISLLVGKLSLGWGGHALAGIAAANVAAEVGRGSKEDTPY